jgi:hypothetical protein
MTEAANIEHQKSRQAELVNDEQQRLLEIEDMRLVVKFGEKKCYSDQECQAIYQELVEAGLDGDARCNLDAIEAVFKKLNADDEAKAASAAATATWHFLARPPGRESARSSVRLPKKDTARRRVDSSCA